MKYDRFDLWLYSLMLLCVIVASIYLLVNVTQHDYTGIYYIRIQLYLFMPFALGLIVFSYFYQKEAPRLAFITWAYVTYFLIYLSLGYLTTSVQFTPFNPIDPILIRMDQFLHFDSLQALEWGHRYLSLHVLLALSYDSLDYQLLFLPYLLSFFLYQERSVKVFYMATLISALIGMSFYYFFPTAAPAHYFHSTLFSLAEQNTYYKFYSVHHYLPIYSSTGGLIAFPSFHIIWAFLITYAYRNIALLFFPLLIINLILTAATLLLGWHYLVDVLGGISVATLSLVISEKTYQWCQYHA